MTRPGLSVSSADTALTGFFFILPLQDTGTLQSDVIVVSQNALSKT